MSAFIINDKVVQVPAGLGLHVINFLDDPKLKLDPLNGRARSTQWVRNHIAHVTVGDAQVVMPGLGPSTDAGEHYADVWNSDAHATPRRLAGAHGVIDNDGTVYQLADLLTMAVFHCGSADNEYSTGWEIKQDKATGAIYQGAVEALVKVFDWLTAYGCKDSRFACQRQVHLPYHGCPSSRINAGSSTVGVFGHRDADANRGVGDPGNAVMQAFVSAGYDAWDYDASSDLVAWRLRQKMLNTDHGAGLTVDGVAGPATQAALAKSGWMCGQWVRRPVDLLL